VLTGGGAAASLDHVRLALLQALWDEPATYEGSGGSIPSAWRSQFGEIVAGRSDAELLASAGDCTMRARLLDHVSYRSAALLNSLPKDFRWRVGEMDQGADLAAFRIVGDGSWDHEVGAEADCLTVGDAARLLLHECPPEEDAEEVMEAHAAMASGVSGASGASGAGGAGAAANGEGTGQQAPAHFLADAAAAAAADDAAAAASPKPSCNSPSCAHHVRGAHTARLAALAASGARWPRTLVAVGNSLTRASPFTLLDGNHRAVLLVGKGWRAGCAVGAKGAPAPGQEEGASEEGGCEPVRLFVGVPPEAETEAGKTEGRTDEQMDAQMDGRADTPAAGSSAVGASAAGLSSLGVAWKFWRDCAEGPISVNAAAEGSLEIAWEVH